MLVIRRPVPEDIPALLALNEAFNGPVSATPESMARALEEFDEELVLIALWSGEAAGFACGQVRRSVCYGECAGEITELYVADKFRRRGVAAHLLERMEHLMEHRGITSLMLFTSCANQAAQKLYLRCGYRDAEEMGFEKKLRTM